MSKQLLSIFSASILANIFVINTVVHVLGIKSKSLPKYYTQLNMIAVCLDLTAAAWGVMLAFKIARYNLVGKIVVAILVQQVHDVLFGAYIRHRAKQGRLSSFLKLCHDYAEEHGVGILKVDAVVMTISVILVHVLQELSTENIVLVGTFGLYMHLLLLGDV